MSLFTIDTAACKRDHVCVHICPFGIVGTGPDGYPMPNPGMQDQCINCGHCMASCPHGALHLATMPQGEPIRPERTITPEQAAQFLMTRRSIRRYQDKVVPRPVLQRVLDMARWAPTAKNVQPVEYLVIERPAETRRLAGLAVEWMRQTGQFPRLVAAWEKGADAVLRSAPHVVIAHAPAVGYKPTVDCTIALTYLDLAANAVGLGCCWAGILMWAIEEHRPLADALQLPAGHQACGALMLGYPQFRYARIPQRNPAKVTWR